MRLIFMGDSVIDGMRIEQKKRFSDLLALDYNPALEVINLAVPGYNFRQEIGYFKKKGLKYKPDIVIFGITYNNMDLEGYSSAELRVTNRVLRKNKTNDFL